MSGNPSTYKLLIASHVQQLRENGASEGTIRNAESALERFMKAARRSRSSSLGNEWQSEETFNSLVARCVKGRPDSSKRSFLSLMRGWRSTACTLLKSNSIDTNDFYDLLRDALLAYQRKYELSVYLLAQRCLIGEQPLRDFLKSKSILFDKSLRLPLDEMETLLEVPKGHLVRAKQSRALPEKRFTAIAYREHTLALRDDRYTLGDPPPIYPVHEEFLALRHFKTTEILPRGMHRGTQWGTRPTRDATTKTPAWAAKLDDSRICPTAQLVWVCIAHYLGWACLPPERGGRGMSAENVSLAYLTDMELIREYFYFHKARHSGRFSSIFIAFLANTASLLREKTGYIRQLPEFGTRLRDPVEQNRWNDWCEHARRDLREMISILKQGCQKHRDPKEPIQAILNRQHPLSAIEEMLENMMRSAPNQRYKRALYKRNHNIIKLLSVAPLRVRNLAALTFNEDNTGHLRRTPDGWTLEVKGREFKNYRHAAQNDFIVSLPVDFHEDLEAYIRVWRPILLERATASDRDILFPQQNGTKYPSQHLSKLVSDLTKKYCPDTPGFGPHAFRHIVATEYLKNNPHGYQVVAYILHDKLDTVLREYGHVTTSDGFAHWTKYLEDSALMSREKDKKPRK